MFFFLHQPQHLRVAISLGYSCPKPSCRRGSFSTSLPDRKMPPRNLPKRENRRLVRKEVRKSVSWFLVRSTTSAIAIALDFHDSRFPFYITAVNARSKYKRNDKDRFKSTDTITSSKKHQKNTHNAGLRAHTKDIFKWPNFPFLP